MAGKKKQAQLTPEEKLQQALVPAAEQPYKVPANWCWTRLGSYIDYATDYVANGSFATLKANVNIYKEKNYALMVKTQDFANHFTKSLTYTDKHGYEFLEKSRLYGGELILSNIGSIGKVFKVPYFDKPMTLASNSIMIKCYKDFDYDFLFYFFSSPIGFELLNSITTGTAVLKFNKTDLKTIALPLPPLLEQQRIVERIESLFAKLDEAKENLQNVLDGFETRKAAILHKAFTGELTANWRKQHDVSIDSWGKKKLGEINEIGTGGTPSRKIAAYYNGNIPWIKTGEILWNYIYDSEEKITNNAINNSSAKFYSKGTVLVAMYGQGLTRGRAAILAIEATTNQAVCALKPKQVLKSKFLFYYFMENYWKYREKAIGGNQPNYSIKMISKWNINLPTLDEQTEIVRIIDDLLAKEQQAKELAENALAKIDLIKKAILARAFRGELGTNNPADEPAVELLKRML